MKIKLLSRIKRLVLILAPAIITAISLLSPINASATSISCPYVLQGGTTGLTADGSKHIYFACWGANGTAYILKYSMSGKLESTGKAYSMWSTMGHSNDMTYNSKLKKLVVAATGDGGASSLNGKVALFSPDTLKYSSMATLSTGGTGHLCYKADSDTYFVNGYIRSPNGASLKKLFSDGYTLTIAKALGVKESQIQGTQGITCDQNYIYAGAYYGGNQNYIIKFNWDGDYVSKSKTAHEVENLFIRSGVLYAGYHDNTKSGYEYYTSTGISTGTESQYLKPWQITPSIKISKDKKTWKTSNIEANPGETVYWQHTITLSGSGDPPALSWGWSGDSANDKKYRNNLGPGNVTKTNTVELKIPANTKTNKYCRATKISSYIAPNNGKDKSGSLCVNVVHTNTNPTPTPTPSPNPTPTPTPSPNPTPTPSPSPSPSPNPNPNRGTNSNWNIPFISPDSIVENVINIMLIGIGIIAVVSIIYAALMLITSSGDPDQLRKGRRVLFYGIIGLAVALLAGVIVNLVLGII